MTAQLINELFDEFKARCRNWERYLATPQDLNRQKQEFTKLLVKSGIRDWGIVQEAKERVCSEERWFQQADDFVALCKEIAVESMGWPSESVSLAQAVGIRTEKHPAVVHTLRQLSTHESHRLKKVLKKEEAEKFWKKRWVKTIDFVLAGGELDLPEPQLEETFTPASTATREKFMAELREI